MSEPYKREMLVCPGCGGAEMTMRESCEMFWNRPRELQPLSTAARKVTVLCAGCGRQIWPETQEKKGKK